MRLHNRRTSGLLLAALLLILAAVHSPDRCNARSQSGQARNGGTGFYTNPAFDADFPDPTVMRASAGWSYAYATQTIIDGRMVNIQVARSGDLINWKHLGDALPVKPVWASQTQKLWAPIWEDRS